MASSPREVIEECDIIVSALPKPVHIKEAFEGDDGILAGMSPGNYFSFMKILRFHSFWKLRN